MRTATAGKPGKTAPVKSSLGGMPAPALVKNENWIKEQARAAEETAREQAAAEAWLTELVEAAQARVAADPNDLLLLNIELTPARAWAFLQRNEDNRRLSPKAAAKLATDMRENRWALNGETIVVADTGQLNNGQHRCEAVILSGVAIRIVLVIGVTRESRNTSDQNKVRNTADFLHMQGVTNAGLISTAASQLWHYRRFNRMLMGRATSQQVLEVALDTPDLAASFETINRGSGLSAYGGKALLTFLHFILSDRAGGDLVDQFFQELMSEAPLAPENPITYIRQRLENGRLKPNEKVMLYIKVWNFWIKGTAIRSLPLHENESLPDIDLPEQETAAAAVADVLN